MIRFLTALGVVTILIYLSVWWLREYNWMSTSPSWQHESIMFLVVLSIATYSYLHKLLRGDPQRFTLFYLGSIVVKLLAGSGFVVIMIMADRKSAFSNAGLFLSTYVAFTILEVLLLFRTLNDRREEG